MPISVSRRWVSRRSTRARASSSSSCEAALRAIMVVTSASCWRATSASAPSPLRRAPSSAPSWRFWVSCSSSTRRPWRNRLWRALKVSISLTTSAARGFRPAGRPTCARPSASALRRAMRAFRPFSRASFSPREERAVRSAIATRLAPLATTSPSCTNTAETMPPSRCCTSCGFTDGTMRPWVRTTRSTGASTAHTTSSNSTAVAAASTARGMRRRRPSARAPSNGASTMSSAPLIAAPLRQRC